MTVIVTKQQIAEAAGKAALCDYTYFRDTSVPPPNGWRVVCTSNDVLQGEHSFFGALYAKTDAETGKTDYTIAFRGSDGNDLKSNFMIAVGGLPSQFKDAYDFVKLAAQRAGIETKDITLTGHSLGGYLARTVARVLDVKKVFAFSSPGPSKEIRAQLEKIAPNALPNDKVIHIRSKNDIIGLWGSQERNTLELDTKKHHHAVKNIRKHLAILSGEVPDPALVHRRAGFLERVFNAVSKPLADGLRLFRALKKLGQYTGNQPPRPAAETILPRAALQSSPPRAAYA